MREKNGEQTGANVDVEMALCVDVVVPCHKHTMRGVNISQQSRFMLGFMFFFLLASVI